MRGIIQIYVIWLILMGGLFFLTLLPHGYIEPVGMINASLQLLLCIISIFIARKSCGNQKYIFYNFAVFFSFVVPLIANTLIGNFFFPGNRFATTYYSFYINKFGSSLNTLFVLLYFLIDHLTINHGVASKYIFSFFITSVIVVYLFQPFVFNPSKLWEQEDYVALRKLERSYQEATIKFNHEPSNNELSLSLAQMLAKDGNWETEFDHASQTVQRLKPFLNDAGERTVFWRQANLNSAIVDGVTLVLIIVFLLLYFFSNRPCPAYMDKIMIFVFLFLALDMFHYLVFIRSYSLANYYAVFRIGQYFTVICLIFLVYVFYLRLNFVRSTTGQYYEQTLMESSEAVTRWRDEIDKFVLRTFSKTHTYLKHIGHTEYDSETSERSIE